MLRLSDWSSNMRVQRKLLVHTLRHLRRLSYQRRITEYSYAIRVSEDANASEVAQAFDKGLDDLISCASDPIQTFSRLELADGLHNVLLGLANIMCWHHRTDPAAVNALACRVVDSPVGEENDHHRLAFLCLHNQEYVKASALWEMALIRNPHDILALRGAQLAYESMGAKADVLAVVERVLPLWNTSAPGYSRVLAMHGYGLQLNGSITDAEETIGRALNISLDNVFATYSLVQAYERACRPREGLRALKELEDTWIQDSPLKVRNGQSISFRNAMCRMCCFLIAAFFGANSASMVLHCMCKTRK